MGEVTDDEDDGNYNEDEMCMCGALSRDDCYCYQSEIECDNEDAKSDMENNGTSVDDNYDMPDYSGMDIWNTDMLDQKHTPAPMVPGLKDTLDDVPPVFLDLDGMKNSTPEERKREDKATLRLLHISEAFERHRVLHVKNSKGEPLNFENFDKMEITHELPPGQDLEKLKRATDLECRPLHAFDIIHDLVHVDADANDSQEEPNTESCANSEDLEEISDDDESEDANLESDLNLKEVTFNGEKPKREEDWEEPHDIETCEI